ncbi:DUF2534 family protein [Klebsiella pneumoniae]|nr:DUF2534 family protein [Klebsiella pneumoniae]
MILQKLLSNKNCKKYCLSLAVVFAIALAVVGRATFGGVVSEYNMPYSEWTTSMFFLQGAMVTVYSIVFTALFAIPLGFIFLGAIVRIKRQRDRGSPGLIGLSTA